MDAYVINLDSRPERWASIQSKFKGGPLRLKRVSAVPHENGAYGNFQSFLKVLRQAKQKGLASVLILEDDCMPIEGWGQRWKTIKSWLDSHPTEWDIYSGGAWGDNSFLQKLAVSLWNSPETIATVGTNIIFKYPVFTFGAHWLYVPKRSYTKMIDMYTRLSFLPSIHSKLGMDMLNGIFFKTVSSFPFIAHQESSFSNIGGTFVEKYDFITNSEKRVKKHLFTRKASKDSSKND